jgi:hypothetical protein
MQYDIKAIPTMYAGVQFRSRLEATWAAFFDLVGWNWEYEPLELSGWFPDFKISRISGGIKELLVEVKPMEFSSGLFSRNDELLRDLCPRLHAAHDKEILILGNRPFEMNGNLSGAIGILSEPFSKEDQKEHGHTSFQDYAVLNHDGSSFDLSGEIGGWGFRFSDKYDGGRHLCPVRFSEVYYRWKEARNITQWQKHA